MLLCRLFITLTCENNYNMHMESWIELRYRIRSRTAGTPRRLHSVLLNLFTRSRTHPSERKASNCIFHDLIRF
jgi:hypothetical protein